MRFLNLIQTIALKCHSVVLFITDQYGRQAKERCIWIKCSECFSLSVFTTGFGVLNKQTNQPTKPLLKTSKLFFASVFVLHSNNSTLLQYNIKYP